MIVFLPCMGIGLRYKTFNEDSKYPNDEIMRGYDPGAYFIVLLAITLVSIFSIIHTEYILNRILILIIGAFCYIWIVFPDKFNKILPFDNRTLPGLIIYLGVIIILFVISIKGLLPPETLNILQHNY
ncbi:hypothetical protein [Methanobrevibacter sp.]|uniref:hypothetical protein n=1 Tax=Methanobrevibacter sp. TaxID=66852 RepID=UPI0026E06D03|nr:hypothetical protein [Methanobrevibacter sp.]